MDWTVWGPALTSTAGLAAIGGIAAFLLGPWYRGKIEGSIKQSFDQQLEILRSQQRRDEEAFKAELRKRDDELAALRSGALSGMASRQAAMAKRRVEAVERLWAGTIELGKLKMASMFVGVMKMDAVLDVAAQENAEGRKMREFGDGLWKVLSLDAYKHNDTPDRERPFLPPMVWALFSAYRAILSYPAVLLASMKTGMDKKVLDNTKILELTKSALPTYSDFIDKHGLMALPHLIEEFERKLLVEIENALDGKKSDEATVTLAASIIKLANDVAATNERPQVQIPSEIRA